MAVSHKNNMGRPVRIDLHTTHAHIVEQKVLHFLPRNPGSKVQKGLDRRSVGGDYDGLSLMLPRNFQDRIPHPAVYLFQRLSARRLRMAAVHIQDILSVEFGILLPDFLSGQAVHFTKVNLRDPGYHDHRNGVLLRCQRIFQGLFRPLKRTGDTQIQVNLRKIVFQKSALTLARFIQRIICPALIAQLLIPGCGAVPDKIYGCFIHCLLSPFFSHIVLRLSGSYAAGHRKRYIPLSPAGVT